jgi:hypothetical protein
MRYIVQISLTNSYDSSHEIYIPGWVNELLPIKCEGRIQEISCTSFHYQTNDKSIVEANWDKPYYSNSDYFIFIGGHVFFRIKEADKKGKYVPSTEEVLSLIVQHGDNHYDVLKGNYHIILFKRRAKNVLVYSSPLSLYPAWYFIEDGQLVISNIMESLLRMKKNVAVNPKGILEYALFDHCIGSGTIYKDLYQFNGGHVLSVTASGKSEKLVYDIIKWRTTEPVKRKKSLESINSVLKRHISEFTGSIKNFNISLTGGFDGRLNFSFIDRTDYSRLEAFSYGMENSLQLKIPELISRILNFRYKDIVLGKDFEKKYAELGMNSIIYSGGITPFIRAMYPFSYGEISSYSRNCILGQCDMIRPLFTNPAGAIFNSFSHDLFYNTDPLKFYNSCQKISGSGYFKKDLFTKEIIENIYQKILETYIIPYPELSNNERYYFFLMKESMLKFWHTECHLVDLFVNDFISFSDLDYLEVLSGSEYFGLYKGIFAVNQFQRRNGQDLYADLMHLNNDCLNDIIVDRFYKPKWIRKGLIGYLMIASGKWKAIKRKKAIGNDTFADSKWTELFYNKFKSEISKETVLFNMENLRISKPYTDNNSFRYARHISLKLWLQYMGII